MTIQLQLQRNDILNHLKRIIQQTSTTPPLPFSSPRARFSHGMVTPALMLFSKEALVPSDSYDESSGTNSFDDDKDEGFFGDLEHDPETAQLLTQADVSDKAPKSKTNKRSSGTTKKSSDSSSQITDQGFKTEVYAVLSEIRDNIDKQKIITDESSPVVVVNNFSAELEKLNVLIRRLPLDDRPDIETKEFFLDCTVLINKLSEYEKAVEQANKNRQDDIDGLANQAALEAAAPPSDIFTRGRGRTESASGLKCTLPTKCSIT